VARGKALSKILDFTSRAEEHPKIKAKIESILPHHPAISRHLTLNTIVCAESRPYQVLGMSPA
jgi:hypothetical protein